VKLGFALEGAYSTPGEGGMCPILHFQACSTLITNRISNGPCILTANCYELHFAIHNQLSISYIIFEKTVIADVSASSLVRNSQVYGAGIVFTIRLSFTGWKILR
jgi:hypothetical protein